MSAIDYARDERGSRATDFTIGLICGATLGAVAGLLMATKPGKQLRGEIAESAERLRHRVTETYHQASDAMTEAMDKGREALRKGRASFDDVRARYDADAAVGAAADHPY